AWLAWLIEHVAWRSDRRIMYERAVDVPRLRANYALDGDESAPDVVLRCAGVAQEAAPAPYNSVGLNYYRNGGDGVAPHNDRMSDLMEGEPIALLSLGGPRTMVISPKTHPRKAVRLSLESGSVLVMDYQSQHHYLHGIPKVRAADARISLAFRVRPLRPIGSVAHD
ncbi:MAG: alpha-ketoglutarate-dependent dioxygenase AlkB, partial [Dokdonella sp.]